MTREARRLIRELVAAVVGAREDREAVGPVLHTMLTVAVADFSKYHDVRHAAHRVIDHQILMARQNNAGESS